MTREEAIKELASHLVHWNRLKHEHIVPTDECENTINALRMAIEALSSDSVQGEWIDKGWKGDWQFETDGRGNCWHEYECSECGFHSKGSKSNFCSHCGARMKGNEKKEENNDVHKVPLYAYASWERSE